MTPLSVLEFLNQLLNSQVYDPNDLWFSIARFANFLGLVVLLIRLRSARILPRLYFAPLVAMALLHFVLILVSPLFQPRVTLYRIILDVLLAFTWLIAWKMVPTFCAWRETYQRAPRQRRVTPEEMSPPMIVPRHEPHHPHHHGHN
jgi:hypothetical protein